LPNRRSAQCFKLRNGESPNDEQREKKDMRERGPKNGRSMAKEIAGAMAIVLCLIAANGAEAKGGPETKTKPECAGVMTERFCGKTAQGTEQRGLCVENAFFKIVAACPTAAKPVKSKAAERRPGMLSLPSPQPRKTAEPPSKPMDVPIPPWAAERK
jgi:hypothetical protein